MSGVSGSSMRAVGWAHALPVSSGPRAARRWARERLESLGWNVTAPQTVDDVLLTVSELVTNAHVHAHSEAHLIMTWDSRCLHVSVHDNSPRLPVPRRPSPDRTGGRGILLLDALADAWQTHPSAHGKTVTACFHPRHETSGSEPSAPESSPSEPSGSSEEEAAAGEAAL